MKAPTRNETTRQSCRENKAVILTGSRYQLVNILAGVNLFKLARFAVKFFKAKAFKHLNQYVAVLVERQTVNFRCKTQIFLKPL